VPVKESLRVIPWAKNQGIAFCKLYNTDNTPFAGCPRGKLEEACAELKNLGYYLNAGFELEFQIYTKVGNQLEILETNYYNNANSLDLLGDDLETIYT
jgi:glutamine synthetase